MPSKIIRKLNRKRFDIFYWNLEKYLKLQERFSEEESEQIQGHLIDNYHKLPAYYKVGVDYIFYRSKDKFGKFVILFNTLKFYYKRLKIDSKNFDFMSKL